MTRTFYHMKDERNIIQLAEAIKEFLTGWEYMRVVVRSSADAPDIHMHHVVDTVKLYPKDYGEDETEIREIWVHDTYGSMFLNSEDVDHVYISWGRGEMSIYFNKSSRTNNTPMVWTFKTTARLVTTHDPGIRPEHIKRPIKL